LENDKGNDGRVKYRSKKSQERDVHHIKKIAGFLQVAVSQEKIRLQRIAMGIEEVADAIVEKEGGVYPKPKNDQEDGQKMISSGDDARHHQKYIQIPESKRTKNAGRNYAAKRIQRNITTMTLDNGSR